MDMLYLSFVTTSSNKLYIEFEYKIIYLFIQFFRFYILIKSDTYVRNSAIFQSICNSHGIKW
jgi:hypothetical protein